MSYTPDDELMSNSGMSNIEMSKEDFASTFLEPLCKSAITELLAGDPTLFNKLVKMCGLPYPELKVVPKETS